MSVYLGDNNIKYNIVINGVVYEIAEQTKTSDADTALLGVALLDIMKLGEE